MRGGQIAVLLGQVAVHDAELTDTLGARDQLIRLVHNSLHGGAYRRMHGRLRDGQRTRQPQVLELLGQGIRIQGHEGRDEGLLIPHQHGLGDQGRGAQMVLRNARNDVLAAGGDDDFLLASHNLQQPGLVELGQVAGTEPAVLGERLGVLLGVLVVPLHDAHTAHQ